MKIIRTHLLNLLIVLACWVILNGCSIHTYCPAVHHIAEDRAPGKLTLGGSLGLNGMNAEAVAVATKHISVIGGLNSSFQTKLKDSSHVRTSADVGVAYLFGKDSTGILFAIAAGGGYGNYTAKNKQHTEVSGESSYDYTVSGYSDLHHYYLQPYIVFRPNAKVHMAVSLKAAWLKYNTYHFYGVGENIFEYKLKHVNRVIAEPAFKFEVGKRLKFFSEIILPVGVYFGSSDKTKDTQRVNDWPGLTFQVGMHYSFCFVK